MRSILALATACLISLWTAAMPAQSPELEIATFEKNFRELPMEADG